MTHPRNRPGGIQPKKSSTDIAKLFENTADGVSLSGPQGKILFWNRAAEAILGYPAQQAVGRSCRDVFAGCDKNGNRICCGWPCPIRTLLQGGNLVEHFDMATRTRTGKPVWIDVSILWAPAGNDHPRSVVHLFRDVTVARQTVARQLEVLVRQQRLRRNSRQAKRFRSPSVN